MTNDLTLSYAARTYVIAKDESASARDRLLRAMLAFTNNLDNVVGGSIASLIGDVAREAFRAQVAADRATWLYLARECGREDLDAERKAAQIKELDRMIRDLTALRARVEGGAL